MFFRGSKRERDEAKPLAAPQSAWPPGHFYSPIPNAQDITTGLARATGPLLGLELNETTQRSFLDQLARVFPRLRFGDSPQAGRRYHYDNGSFGGLDAICLAAMVQHSRPRQVVEVGSGYSSAALLDLRDDGLLPDCELTFIDPDFSRLHPLLLPGDSSQIKLIENRVQDVGLEVFSTLRAGDLLFIDSSHVSKVGSDVNHVVFEILPRLSQGVIVHFHDVFEGFEYPREWFDEGRHWNEQYLVRAFLMFNSAFEILLQTSYVFNRFNEFFRTHMPITLRYGGGQLWLRRK